VKSLLTSFDTLFIVAALIFLIIGLTRRWSLWLEKKRGTEPQNYGNRHYDDRHSGNWKLLLNTFITHSYIRKRPGVGLAHLAIFWGFILPLGVALIAQFGYALPTAPARILSLLQEAAGILMLAGTIYLLKRRILIHRNRIGKSTKTETTGVKAVDTTASAYAGKSWTYQPDSANGPGRTILPMILLILILISGFLAEASRLSITGNSAAWASPVGWILSLGTPASPFFMQMMIRFHFFTILLLIASAPFTFMRHSLSAPLNIFYRRKSYKGTLRIVEPTLSSKGKMEGIGAGSVEDFSWRQILNMEACVSCGRCEEHCPAFISGKPLSPRRIVQKILTQIEAESSRKEFRLNPLQFFKEASSSFVGSSGISCPSGSKNNHDACRASAPAIHPLLEDIVTKEELWACTTCMACVEQCPVFVEAMDKIVDMRRYLVMGKGELPSDATPVIRNLELFGDVQGKGAAYRADWAMHRNVPHIINITGEKILFWVGCSGAFHPRNRETSLALVKIMNHAGINFGILAQEERCCGDPARRLGDEELFRRLAMENIEQFKQYQIRKIVTLCPHCLNTLKNEYTDLGCDIPVVHATQFVSDLVETEKISLKYPIFPASANSQNGTQDGIPDNNGERQPIRIAVHDACYLGRYNDIYQPPRALCRAFTESTLTELPRNMENGFCCGGGGGRMWLHEGSGENINMVRAREIVETDVDIVATSCPYCLVMLDDGVKSLEKGKIPKVLDIIDLVADAI